MSSYSGRPLIEIEELRSENNVLKQSLQTNREYINVTMVSKDAEIEGFKEDNEGLRVQLLHLNNLTIQNRDLIKERKNMNVINDILKEKLLSVENQTNYYHTYQCSMCEFYSGHRDKVTDHMNKNHKKAYEAEETYCVDCMCKKLFYDQEDLEKHEKEHKIKCGICGACMN